MKIDILTIFPKIFNSFLNESLLKKGLDNDIIDIGIYDIRGYTKDKHGNVDDAPYGGGAGMVMTPQPLADAIKSLKKDSTKTILLTPAGKPFTQDDAKRLSKEKNLIFVCGRYEGIDQRIADEYIDEEISIGDFVLNGGETASMVLIESIFRLLPGAIGDEASHQNDSFEDGLLEHPHYTRPEIFDGKSVPEILLSGHHKNIKKWREDESIKKTGKVRPDLLLKVGRAKVKDVNFSIALIHNPVLGKEGDTITSSITTLDVHDFARLGKTYGAKNVYIVTPVEDQKRLVERLKNHWMEGDFLKNEFTRRVDALDIVETAVSFDEVYRKVKRRSKKVKVLATSAVESAGSLSPDQWAVHSGEADEWIILFGTAYGLAPELTQRADFQLSPIKGRGEFNHLPVRGASAIVIHSLFGN